MKKAGTLAVVLLLAGCSGEDLTSLGYSEAESERLLQLTDRETVEGCAHPESLKALLPEAEDETDVALFCQITNAAGMEDALKQLKDAGVSEAGRQEYLQLSYFRSDRTKRYLTYADEHPDMAVKDVVLTVNMNLDQPFYTDITVIEDTDDMLQLVNKYSRLPDDFAPDDLVETPGVCSAADFSCYPGTQYVRKEVAEHLQAFMDAAEEAGFTMKSIASLRDIDYQRSLYNYYKEAQGQEYADTYYARPGQSEHNSALAVDVTFDDLPYNEIETSPHYAWFMEHMADYGFILRYPQGKEDITGFGYESWHIRYVGKEAAASIMEQGITLEEYLAMQPEE